MKLYFFLKKQPMKKTNNQPLNPVYLKRSWYSPKHHYLVGAAKTHRKFSSEEHKIGNNWGSYESNFTPQVKKKSLKYRDIFKHLEKTSKQLSKLTTDLDREQASRKTGYVKLAKRIEILEDSVGQIVEASLKLSNSGLFPRYKFKPENYHYIRPVRVQTEKQKQASLANFQKLLDSNSSRRAQ